MSPQILVVDDEATIRDLLRAVLEDEGYEVATASGAGDALAALATLEPALVLSDVAMPVVSGLELCRRIRARGGRVPVVLMSASYAPDPADEHACGADGFLSKPFDLDQLLQTVTRYAGLPRNAAGVLI